MLKPIWIAAALLLAACSPDAVEGSSATRQELGVMNAVQVEDELWAAGQPTPGQLDALHGLGLEHLIHLRPLTEEGTGWEEARTRELGIDFVRIPVAGPQDMTEENARALHDALERAGDDEVWVVCSSSNRVGGLLALRAYHIQGVDAEEALALGLRAGLTRAEPAVRKNLGLPERAE